MPRSSHFPETGSRPTAWVFAAPGAGDNRQLETLIELIDADARWIGPVDPVRTVLAERILDAGGRRIPGSKRMQFAPPWPDLVLIAGGRSAIDARRVRRASGGRSKIVSLGRPWAPLRWFDLVLTTPQYRLPETPNLVTLDLPLNRPPGVDGADLDRWRSEFDALPRPWMGVLLGGDSGSYRFTGADAGRLGDSLNRVLGDAGGSAIVVSSPRTPESIPARLEARLNVPARVCPFGSAENPYAAMFELADALLVTSDSASMLAEACLSGKQVATFALHERPSAWINRRLRAATSFLQPVLRRLSRRGLWIPARDLDALEARLRAMGRTKSLDRLEFDGAVSTIDAETVFGPARERILALVGR
ncbi:MAG: ELM1/GtrOC1 family putative glycosyltransferase [Candidatus Wenzhouxiangella sp. M2_3B_020]